MGRPDDLHGGLTLLQEPRPRGLDAGPPAAVFLLHQSDKEVARMPADKKKFKVVVQRPAGGMSFDPAEGAYAIEREALDRIGAEIVELPAKTEDEFIALA